MKHIFLLLAVASCISCGSSAPLVAVKTDQVRPLPDPNQTQVTMVLPDISAMKSVEKTMSFLASDELKGRDTGTPGIEMAAQFIEARFKDAGLTPVSELSGDASYRNRFRANGNPAFNIVGMVEGTDPQLKKEYVVIGAHYDHIGYGKKVGTDSIANGANDNAAGTTAVLALADHFAKAKKNKRTLVFALFSAEEKGLLGSKELAQKMKLAKMDVYLVFNIEMIGVPMRDKDHLVYASGYELSNFPEVFNRYAGKHVIGFLPKAQEFNLFKRSDNYPFYEAFGIPAHTVSSFDFTNYEHYHGVNDEADLMDVPFMEQAIKAFIPGLEGIANSGKKEIHMKNSPQ